MMTGFVFVLVIMLVGTTLAQPPKLPNIGYMGYGYNVFTGNPQASNRFDPGFGQVPVFDFTYNKDQTTADGKWLVPDNVVVPGSATECTVQGSTTVIQFTADYQSSLSIDATFDISGYGAAFSGSSDYQEVDQSTTTDNDVFVSASASCQTYLVNLNPYIHPNFSSVFYDQAINLPTSFDPSNASDFWEFLDLVGTHFPTQIIYGSRWGYSFQSSSSQWSSMQSIGLNVDVAASYAGEIRAGVNVDTNYAQQMAQNFTSLTTTTYEFGLGLPPPQDGNTQEWLQDSLSSTFMDPIQYALENISVLFSPEYTQDPEMQARWIAVDAALIYYCELHLVPENVVANCDAPPIPPPPPPPMGYGAFACGLNNGKLDCENDFASVFDGLSNIQAQEVVLDYCPTCQIVASFSDGACLALAISAKHNYFAVQWNENQTEVDNGALADCEQVSQQSCNLILSGCSNPPPTNAQWGAIACTSSCDSYYGTGTTGYPDRIEAHKVAMDSLQGSFIAIDFNMCGAVAKGSNGFASAEGDTPQDAYDAAMATCQATMGSCKPLTYACVNPTTLENTGKKSMSGPISPSMASRMQMQNN